MFTNDLLLKIRGKFHHIEHCPYQGERIFFENAGGALTLKSVVTRSSELAAIPDNQGRNNPASDALINTIQQAKQDIHDFFGAPKGTVFVGESGTELIFRIISAALLSTASGGEVIGSTLEHPQRPVPVNDGQKFPDINLSVLITTLQLVVCQLMTIVLMSPKIPG